LPDAALATAKGTAGRPHKVHWRRLDLEELPGAVPFKVFVPAKAPGRHPFVQVRKPEPRRGTPLFVVISYSVPKPGGGHGNLWLNESAEREKPSAVPNPNETWRQVDNPLAGPPHPWRASSGPLRPEQNDGHRPNNMKHLQFEDYGH
jgi:hypothetical protein